MKTRLLVGVSLGLALSALTPNLAAATTGPALDPMALGAVDGVLQFCTRIDASHSASYAALRVKRFGNRSRAIFAAAQQTAQYQDALKQLDTILVGAPLPWATRSCLRIIGITTAG